MTTRALMELADRLERAVTTMINDDVSEPLSDKRARMIERVETINDAVTQLRTAAAEGGEFVPYDIARKLLGDACTSGMAGLGWGKQAEELFDAIAVITDSGAWRDGVDAAANLDAAIDTAIAGAAGEG